MAEATQAISSRKIYANDIRIRKKNQEKRVNTISCRVLVSECTARHSQCVFGFQSLMI